MSGLLLAEYILNDMSVDICEPEVTPLVSVHESGMVDTEEVQYGCVQVVDVHGARRPVLFVGLGFHGVSILVRNVVAIFVGLAVSDT